MTVPIPTLMRHVHALRRPRRTATVMLLVWLLATFASWANACLVQPPTASSAQGPHRWVGVAEATHGAADDAVAAADRTRAPDPGPQACASFCETEQSIVAKAQPSKNDLGADQAVLPSSAVDGWTAFTPGRSELRWRPFAAPPPPGTPVVIAFLRLTL